MWHCIHRGNALRWFTCLWRAGRSVSIELSFTQLFMIRTDWHNMKHCETLWNTCNQSLWVGIFRMTMGEQTQRSCVLDSQECRQGSRVRHIRSPEFRKKHAMYKIQMSRNCPDGFPLFRGLIYGFISSASWILGASCWFWHPAGSCIHRFVFRAVFFCKNHNIIHYSIHYSDHRATATFSKCFETLCLCTGSAPQVRKVLICHASVGSGHSRAAQAWHPGGPGNRGHDDVNSFGPSCRWRASEGWTCQKVAYGKLVCLTGWLSNYLILFGWLISPPISTPPPSSPPPSFSLFPPWQSLNAETCSKCAQWDWLNLLNGSTNGNQATSQSLSRSGFHALELSLSLSQWFTSSFITYSLTQSFKVWLHRLEM